MINNVMKEDPSQNSSKVMRFQCVVYKLLCSSAVYCIELCTLRLDSDKNIWEYFQISVRT